MTPTIELICGHRSIRHFTDEPISEAQREAIINSARATSSSSFLGSDSNLLIVFYVQIMPDDLVMQLHRF